MSDDVKRPVLPTNPYVGPRAFEEGEGERFFGRERGWKSFFTSCWPAG
jgi:hypothetical protein